MCRRVRGGVPRGASAHGNAAILILSKWGVIDESRYETVSGAVSVVRRKPAIKLIPSAPTGCLDVSVCGRPQMTLRRSQVDF